MSVIGVGIFLQYLFPKQKRWKKGLTDNQKKVYEAMKKDGHMSLQEIADKCDLSLGGVKKICGILREYGLIET